MKLSKIILILLIVSSPELNAQTHASNLDSALVYFAKAKAYSMYGDNISSDFNTRKCMYWLFKNLGYDDMMIFDPSKYIVTVPYNVTMSHINDTFKIYPVKAFKYKSLDR